MSARSFDVRKGAGRALFCADIVARSAFLRGRVVATLHIAARARARGWRRGG